LDGIGFLLVVFELLLLLGFLPFLLPTGNGRRCCPQQFVSLRSRQEAGCRRAGLFLPARDHLARAWA
jgi:hypothetical protein